MKKIIEEEVDVGDNNSENDKKIENDEPNDIENSNDKKGQVKEEEKNEISQPDSYICYYDELDKMLLQYPSIENRKRAVLICTGAFCPVHKGHLKLLDTASKFLREFSES